MSTVITVALQHGDPQRGQRSMNHRWHYRGSASTLSSSPADRLGRFLAGDSLTASPVCCLHLSLNGLRYLSSTWLSTLHLSMEDGGYRSHTETQVREMADGEVSESPRSWVWAGNKHWGDVTVTVWRAESNTDDTERYSAGSLVVWVIFVCIVW